MPSSAWKKNVCRSEEHTSELQSLTNLVCRLLLEKKRCRKAGNCTRCRRVPRGGLPPPPDAPQAWSSHDHPPRCRGADVNSRVLKFLFFLNEPGPPETPPLPHPAPLRI